MKILVISQYKNAFSEGITAECLQQGIDCTELYFNNFDKITIERENVIINGKAIEHGTIIFHSGFFPDFLTVPPTNLIYDYTLFNDTQLSQEQLQSHYLSTILTLGRMKDNVLINDPFKLFGLSSILTPLAALKSHGYPIVDFISTNSYKLFTASDLASQKEVLWSYNTFDSPYREISTKRVGEILNGKNSLPFMFYRKDRGDLVRIWFFRDVCLFGAKIINPVYEYPEERLEKFEFIPANETTEKVATDLYEFFDYDFYSIDILVNEESQIIVYRYNPMPMWDYLPPEVQKFGVENLLNAFRKLIGLEKIPTSILPEEGKRSPIFLTRMMEALFELNETTK